MRLSLPQLFQHSICLNRWRNEKLNQCVHQKRASVSNFFSVFSRHVQLSGMSIFVPGKPACVADFLKMAGQFQLQDFVVKALSFFELYTALNGNVVSDSFYANTKKCTGRSGRRMGDSLRFVEDVFDVLRHVFNCLKPCARWIHKFTVRPEMELFTMHALGHKVAGFRLYLKEIIGREVEIVETIRISVETFVTFVPIKDGMFFYLANNAAVRTTK